MGSSATVHNTGLYGASRPCALKTCYLSTVAQKVAVKFSQIFPFKLMQF